MLTRTHALVPLATVLVAACSVTDLDSLAGSPTAAGGASVGGGAAGASGLGGGGSSGVSGRAGGFAGSSGKAGAAGAWGGSAGFAGGSGTGAAGASGGVPGGTGGIVAGASGAGGAGAAGGNAAGKGGASGAGAAGAVAGAGGATAGGGAGGSTAGAGGNPGGGAGSAGTSATNAGAGGSGPTCSVVNPCAASTDPCLESVCEAGSCVTKIVVGPRTELTQVKGNCQRAICGAAGKIVNQTDDTDVPTPSGECTMGLCAAGVAANKDREDGAACGGGVCKAGKCEAFPCGNGVLDAGEMCDRASSAAPPTCALWGRGSAGSLSCTASCAWSFEACTSPLLLFGGTSTGGTNSGVLLNDTWEWKDGWKQVDSGAVGAPSKRYYAGLGSTGNGEIVLFGGFDGFFWRDDTFLWNGSSWSQLKPEHTPPSRFSASLGTLNGRVVMFGGYSGITSLNDTWEWDGKDWTDVTPAGESPPAGDGNAMTNAGGDRLVLFVAGGTTWQWKDHVWTQLPGTSPSPRQYLGAASFGIGLVLFGGSVDSGAQPTGIHREDTWSWSVAGGWSLVQATTPALTPRRGYAIGPSRGRAVLFGGIGPTAGTSGATKTYADVAEWNGTDWTAVPAGSGKGAPSPRGGVSFTPR